MRREAPEYWRARRFREAEGMICHRAPSLCHPLAVVETFCAVAAFREWEYSPEDLRIYEQMLRH